ncbi:MAG: HlyD family efflux transporter periplasmic adaptor subunit [Planctomycetota bacterium]
MLKWLSRVFRVVLGVGALAAAVGLFMLLRATKPEPAMNAGAERPMVVLGVVAKFQPIGRVFEGYGTARAMNSADIAAELSARVVSRPERIEAGETIGEGDTIVELDPGDFEARASSIRQAIEATIAEIDGLEVEEGSLREQVRSAEDELEVARRELARAEEAAERGAVNKSETDQRVLVVRQAERALSSLRNQFELVPSRRASLRATLQSRQADLREAERNVERASITSPISGVLQRVEVEAGEFVRPGDVVARVVDLSRIEVPVRVPVSASGKVRRGDAVELRPESDPGTVWTGVVSRVSPEADERSRSIEVFVEVRQDPEGDSVLLPGRFVLATLRLRGSDERLVTPRRTVDDGTVLIAEAIDVETEISAELAQFDAVLKTLPNAEAEALAEGGEAARRSWLLENNARLRRLVAAERPRRVQEAQVIVDRYVDESLPDVLAGERQWAVLAESNGAGRGLTAGQLVLLSNLDQLRVGMEIDVRLPGEIDDREAETEIAERVEGATSAVSGVSGSTETDR